MPYWAAVPFTASPPNRRRAPCWQDTAQARPPPGSGRPKPSRQRVPAASAGTISPASWVPPAHARDMAPGFRFPRRGHILPAVRPVSPESQTESPEGVPVWRAGACGAEKGRHPAAFTASWGRMPDDRVKEGRSPPRASLGVVRYTANVARAMFPLSP